MVHMPAVEDAAARRYPRCSRTPPARSVRRRRGDQSLTCGTVGSCSRTRARRLPVVRSGLLLPTGGCNARDSERRANGPSLQSDWRPAVAPRVRDELSIPRSIDRQSRRGLRRPACQWERVTGSPGVGAVVASGQLDRPRRGLRRRVRGRDAVLPAATARRAMYRPVGGPCARRRTLGLVLDGGCQRVSAHGVSLCQLSSWNMARRGASRGALGVRRVVPGGRLQQGRTIVGWEGVGGELVAKLDACREVAVHEVGASTVLPFHDCVGELDVDRRTPFRTTQCGLDHGYATICRRRCAISASSTSITASRPRYCARYRSWAARLVRAAPPGW